MQKGFRVKNRICILGNNSIYTKMICKEFDDAGVKYYLILEKTPLAQKKYFSKLCTIPLKLDNLLNSGKYKALPKLSFFTWKLVIEDLLFKKSSRYKMLVKLYINYVPKTKNIYYTPSVNHVKTKNIIEDLKLDVGLFGGVGIVDGLIIGQFKKFCINAHPAPLPECRGGGALENTLYYGLKPSVSVHFATAGIDEGEIIKVNELQLSTDDCFHSISVKLSILCAESLLQFVLDFENDLIKSLKYNDGKLHYWKDCNINIQKIARKNLKRLLDELK